MYTKETLNMRAVITAVLSLGTNHKGEGPKVISWESLHAKAITLGYHGNLSDLRELAETSYIWFDPAKGVSRVTDLGNTWLKINPAPKQAKAVLVATHTTPTVYDIVMSIVAAGRLKLEEVVKKLSELSKSIRKMDQSRRMRTVNKMIDQLLGLGKVKIDRTPDGVYVEGLVAT